MQVRRGDQRVCQDFLSGHAAHDPRAGQGHLGHLRVVPVSGADAYIGLGRCRQASKQRAGTSMC